MISGRSTPKNNQGNHSRCSRFRSSTEESGMNKKNVAVISITALAMGLGGAAFAQSKADKKMSFFITSAGSGKGADLGGLAGADKLCQSLGDSAGVKRTWHAYLSASAQSGQK